MRIVIETIPHEDQRYPTVGDWWIGADGTWHICVSKMSDWRHEVLVGLHELAEMTLCIHGNIAPSAIDQFDIAYENNRPEGSTDEPGDSPFAPYHHEHCIATGLERVMAASLDVAWKDYDEEITNL